MRKSIVSVLMATVISAVLGLGILPGGAADKDNDSFSDRIHAVNDAAKKSGMMKTAVHSISVETGVPEAQVEAMHKKFSDTGIAGVLMACVMADESKKAPEYFLNKHQSGKSWTALAREHNVSLDKINTRLDHVERSLTPAVDSKEHKRNTQKKLD